MAHTWCKKPHCTHSHTAPPSGAPPRRPTASRGEGRGLTRGSRCSRSRRRTPRSDMVASSSALAARARLLGDHRLHRVLKKSRCAAARGPNGPCAAAAATARRIAATSRRSSEEQLGSNTTAVERGRPRAPGRRPRRTGAFTHLHCHTSILIRPYLSHTIYFQLQLP